jgi:hypothetical protein
VLPSVDDSLHVVSSRPAELAETIVTSTFKGTKTRGFASPADPSTAVCLRPGTEIVFDYAEVVLFRKKIKVRLARFRQINMDNPAQHHHDALEFANGRTVSLTDLVAGQKAKILQLPAPMSQSDKPAVTESRPPVLA